VLPVPSPYLTVSVLAYTPCTHYIVP